MFSKNLRVSGFGGGGRGSDVEGCVESDGDRGKTKFAAAGLVAELEGNFLGAERGVGVWKNAISPALASMRPICP